MSAAAAKPQDLPAVDSEIDRLMAEVIRAQQLLDERLAELIGERQIGAQPSVLAQIVTLQATANYRNRKVEQLRKAMAEQVLSNLPVAGNA